VGGTTTKWAFPYPVLGDAANVPLWIEDLADALDLIVTTYATGTAAARPAGKAGQWYRATDTGVISFYDTAWRDVNVITAGSVTHAMLAAAVKPSSGAADGTEALRALGVSAGQAASGVSFQAHINDNQSEFNAIKSAWTSFTPTLIASGGGLSYGSGGATGHYLKIGRTVWWRAGFRWIGGSVGSGFYTLTPPIGTPVEFSGAAAGGSTLVPVGHGYIIRSSDARLDPLTVVVRDADEFFIKIGGQADSNIGAAHLPQNMVLTGVYETTS
jgi:hypothetical protein